jgi:seryl-tRNA synthetase
MNEEFINEDLERDNEIFKRITSALTDCDRDVNGEKEEEGQSESLQEKRRVIIGDINKMVKQFNEYNKLIKDQNKTHNVDISLLIQTSKEIQDDCKEIESKI